MDIYILIHILHFRRSAFYKNVLMRPVNQFILSIPTAVHLHKSMYSDIVPLHNTLTKVATKSWVSTGGIWNQSQTIFYCVKKSCSSLKWKIKKLYIRWTPLEKIVLIGWQTITILHHKHLQAQLLDSDIWVRQHHTLTSEDDFCWLPFFYRVFNHNIREHSEYLRYPSLGVYCIL